MAPNREIVRFREWDVVVQYAMYGNGRVAIQLLHANSGAPVATCTVNIPDEPLEPGEVLVKDYAENAGMLAWLLEHGIVELTDKPDVRTGYVLVPVCRLKRRPN